MDLLSHLTNKAIRDEIGVLIYNGKLEEALAYLNILKKRPTQKYWSLPFNTQWEIIKSMVDFSEIALVYKKMDYIWFTVGGMIIPDAKLLMTSAENMLKELWENSDSIFFRGGNYISTGRLKAEIKVVDGKKFLSLAFQPECYEVDMGDYYD